MVQNREMEKGLGECTYMKYSQKSINHCRAFLVLLPMREHRYMVPDYNVAFTCKLCSNKRYQGPDISFWYDNWQLAPVRPVDPVETMSHINSSLPSLLSSWL